MQHNRPTDAWKPYFCKYLQNEHFILQNGVWFLFFKSKKAPKTCKKRMFFLKKKQRDTSLFFTVLYMINFIKSNLNRTKYEQNRHNFMFLQSRNHGTSAIKAFCIAKC